MNVFKNIGYNPKDIKKVLNRTKNKTYTHTLRANNNIINNDNTHKPNVRAYLPYIKGVTDKIAKVLKDITTSFKTVQTIKQKMRSIKDPIDHKQCKGI